MIYAMLAPALIAVAELPSVLKPLTEEQKILHVLNRLGFGARPGDIAKVKAVGLQKYIDQQLDAGSINDSVAEAKVKNLDIFSMSTAELFAKYPNPGALLRQLDGQGKKAANAQTAKPGAPANGAAPPASQADPNALTPDEQRERREKIQAYYKEYNLKPARQIVPEIAANRILRAVYSERQLQEVMVDFWQNHFNRRAAKECPREFQRSSRGYSAASRDAFLPG